ncbi:hypothetical protein EBB07_16465 [Paenibacillaceae bacterium]|nr:hypothetical protein EBB07_16465 [Paenibacillaceae bacterium]
MNNEIHINGGDVMSKFSKMKYAVSGFMVGAVFFGSVAFAATTKIEVSFDPVKFIIDKVDKTPVNNKFNNNGTTAPASLMYQGTTYIPIRLVSDMFNKPIKWDGKTKSILVGDSVAGGDYLTSKAPAKVGDRIQTNIEMTMNGQQYQNGLYFPVNTYQSKTTEQSYNLNAQYNYLSFTYGAIDHSDDGTSSSITVFGDGKELWTSNAVKGVPPQDAKVSINGVLNLEIKIETSNYRIGTVIANPILSK